MGRPSKLSEDQRDEVLRLRADGWSSPRIAVHLRSRHGIEMSRSAIAAIVKTERRDRAKTTKPIVAKYLEKKIPGDLEKLERAQRANARIARNAKKMGNPVLEIRAREAERKIIDTRLKYAGAAEPDEPALTGLGDLLGLGLAEEELREREPARWVEEEAAHLAEEIEVFVGVVARLADRDAASGVIGRLRRILGG